MSHCRDVRSVKVANTKAARLQKDLASSTAALDTVIRVLPDAGRLIGKASASSSVGRLKHLKPADLKILCRGMHLGSKANANLGVKHKRLICVGARLILQRQQRALRYLVEAGGAVLAGHQGLRKSVHVSYSHMWDEVNAKFKLERDRRFRASSMTASLETLMQKGSLMIALTDELAGASWLYREQLLCQAKHLQGTSAEALLPALLGAMLAQVVPDSRTSEVAHTLERVTSVTVMLMGDKASGNVLAMKRIAKTWEVEQLPSLIPRYLVWFETCSNHMHHRAKLQIKTLRAHTVHHFSVANLYRVHNVQHRMLSKLETLVASMVRRRIGVAPDVGEGALHRFVDILFMPDRDQRQHDDRAAPAQQQDLLALCRMVNGDVRGVESVHWCWDSDTRTPCCRNHEEVVEKTLVAVVNALFGKADPVPAESRWTHTLANFKKTLLRKVVHNVGLACFSGDGSQEPTIHQIVHRARIAKTMSYYGDEGQMHELIVLTVLLQVVDSTLLYPFLGNNKAPDDRESKCKVGMALDKSTSLVGACTERLLHLLHHWTGLVDRKPWAILDTLQAPVHEDDDRQFARSQILRTAAAFCKRYEEDSAHGRSQ